MILKSKQLKIKQQEQILYNDQSLKDYFTGNYLYLSTIQAANLVIDEIILFITMLGVPLNSTRLRRLSISSIDQEDNNSRKVSAVIDEQKRTIRKLTLKVNKLEEIIKKQRTEQNTSKEDNSVSGGKNPHFQMLKLEIEKSGILQNTLYKISHRIDNISVELAPKVQEDQLFDENFKDLYKSVEKIERQNPEGYQYNHDLQTFMAIERCFSQLQLLQSTLKNMKLIIIGLKKENFTLKGNIQKEIQSRKKTSFDVEQLRDIKIQFEVERRRCAKLKQLLEKSEFERNSMLTSIDKLSTIESDRDIKTHSQLLKLSKKLSFQVNHLEKEKNDILKESLKEKESWANKYREFLKMLKKIKKQ